MSSIGNVRSLFTTANAVQDTHTSDRGNVIVADSNLSTANVDRDSLSLGVAAGALKETAGDDGVRYDKVAQLSASIADNSYNVPTGKLAYALIGSLLGGR